MNKTSFKYVIVGAGLAGASAIEGIREVDKEGSILMIGREPDYPYHRPPLSKKLWTGEEQVEKIYVHDSQYYKKHNVELHLQVSVGKIDSETRNIFCSDGNSYTYNKLLIATGGEPKKLMIPGGELDGICYFRTRKDYLSLRDRAKLGTTAVVIGGGFIGSELAAALASHQTKVSMIFPENYLVQRVFPESLGLAINELFKERGIELILDDEPIEIRRLNGKFVTLTKQGQVLHSDLLVVGVGLQPAIDLCKSAKIISENGIVVDEFLQTSNPDIYAAGDNALYPSAILNRKVRVEHWDQAIHQGKQAGRNMAGAEEAYTYVPFFYSDLFKLSYEAVGEINSELEVYCDWEKENDKGIIYYLRDQVICGVMACNVWNKMEIAREVIRMKMRLSTDSSKGLIEFRDQKKDAPAPLPEALVKELCAEVPDWARKNGSLEKEFEFKTFEEALAFVNEVGKIAEKELHHPDIHIFYNKVLLDLTTHDVGGLSKKDFDLAKVISLG